MFGTAFMIMAVKGTSDDFAQGFMKNLPKYSKRLMSKNLGKVMKEFPDNPNAITHETINTVDGEFDVITCQRKNIRHETIITPNQYKSIRNKAGSVTGKTGAAHAADYMENVLKKQEANDLVLVSTSEIQKQGRGFDLLYFSESQNKFYVVEVKESGIIDTMNPKLGEPTYGTQMSDKWASTTLDKNVDLGDYENLRGDFDNALNGKSSTVSYEKIYVTYQPEYPDKVPIHDDFIDEITGLNGHAKQSRVVQIYPETIKMMG